MSKKSKPDSKGFVYSTDPNFRFEEEEREQAATLPPAQQLLKVRLDTKNRGGKAVTLVQGFVGTEEDLEELGKKIKNFCGTGGAVKDWEVIIQGDQRDKVMQWMQKNGYTKAKKM
jgi:translation initiation factor 1